MRMPAPGDPEHEPICTLIEAADKAETAGMKAMADCLKMVVVSQLNGTCEALLHHLVESLLSTAFGSKLVLGPDDDEIFKSSSRGFQLEPEEDGT